jgi:hypothetical protein
MTLSRRDFLKSGLGGTAALVVGAAIPAVLESPLFAAVQVTTVNLRITDMMKEMVTHNATNDARCYYWCYKEAHYAMPDCPGPIIFAIQGQRIQLILTNDLDEPHSFGIPGVFLSGPVLPGRTITRTFVASQTGTFLYYDYLNAPVNRMMGLHGAFIVMPAKPVAGHKLTPYSNPSPGVQQLFDDLGTAPWWPGLAWDEGDPSTDTPGCRQNIWVLHEASPNLQAEVGHYTVGKNYPAADFVQRFLHDPFSPTRNNNVAQYFTVSGQSGHFSHNNPYICPYNRVGEPTLIRILNAGLWTHSTHIHANHVYVLRHNNKSDPFAGSLDNPIWVDVYTAQPLDTYDWLVPYMRPPDVPNDLGIGRDDMELGLPVIPTPVPAFGTSGGSTPFGDRTWPPLQELDFHIPRFGERRGTAQDGVTEIDLGVHMSPLCFPMHDHSEPSQVSQGGNYNCGMISGIIFTGDRKGGRPGDTAKVITFPMKPTVADCLVAHGPYYKDGVVPPTVPFMMPSMP